MTTYSLQRFKKIVGGTLQGDNRIATDPIHFISLDSRTILEANHTVFFALKGEKADGHEYIADAYKKGVRWFVVHQCPEELPANALFLQVHDVLEALQRIAAHHRAHFHYPVTAITGSNGKTIVKEWLAELIDPEIRVVRSPRSYNSQIGNPLSIWQMNESHNLAIFEAGISKPGEMKHLAQMLKPDWGIFTHLGTAHLENFESQLALAREKLTLFTDTKLLVYCSDFPVLNQAIAELDESLPVNRFTWSFHDSNANLYISKREQDRQQTKLTASCEGKKLKLALPFTDDAHVEDGIHCWAFLLATGQQHTDFAHRFMNLSTVAMRMELKQGVNQCILIDDTYNSDTGSLINALDFLHQQSDNGAKKCTLILSDLLQTGRNSRELYQEVANLIQLRKVNRFIGIGPSISAHAEIFNKETSRFFPSTKEFMLHLGEDDFHNEVILIKGARTFRFDQISTLLQKKAHQTVMEIDLGAMVHNLNTYRKKLKPSTKVMAMVKAFSYGTGSVEVARVLQFHRVDYLAVAIADEGVELRQQGIEVPIVVMNPEAHSFDTMIENRLEPNIYRLEQLAQFESAVRRNAARRFPIHIKTDTGMHRLGFDDEESIDQLIQQIKASDHLYIRSVFSHLAASDETGEDDYTQTQFARFDALTNRIRSSFEYPIERHILNTAGIERFPQKQYEMVRLGIGLYGVSSFIQNELRNVATLKTTISQIRHIAPGETVGYSRKGVVNNLATIAVLPIGYADGLNRRLSNGRGKVLINGKKAPIIGTICMDMCMIDITGITAREGDYAILFGAALPLQEIATLQETIPYEILTTIGQRVKRVYFTD